MIEQKTFNESNEHIFALMRSGARVAMLLELINQRGSKPLIVPWLRYVDTNRPKHAVLPVEALTDPLAWMECSVMTGDIVPYTDILTRPGEYYHVSVNSSGTNGPSVPQYRFRIGNRLNVLDPPHMRSGEVFARSGSAPRTAKQLLSLEFFPGAVVAQESTAKVLQSKQNRSIPNIEPLNINRMSV